MDFFFAGIFFLFEKLFFGLFTTSLILFLYCSVKKKGQKNKTKKTSFFSRSFFAGYCGAEVVSRQDFFFFFVATKTRMGIG